MVRIRVLQRGVKDAISTDHVRVDRISRSRTPYQLDRNPPGCLRGRVLVQVCVLQRLVNDGVIGDYRPQLVGRSCVPLHRVKERPVSGRGNGIVIDVAVYQRNVEVPI